MAGFLLLAHITGLLFYGPSLSAPTLAYGALVIVSLAVFCFTPRRWLVRLRVPVAVLALAAIATTVVQMVDDYTLVNGADGGALMFRSLLLVLMFQMLKETKGVNDDR